MVINKKTLHKNKKNSKASKTLKGGGANNTPNPSLLSRMMLRFKSAKNLKSDFNKEGNETSLNQYPDMYLDKNTQEISLIKPGDRDIQSHTVTEILRLRGRKPNEQELIKLLIEQNILPKTTLKPKNEFNDNKRRIIVNTIRYQMAPKKYNSTATPVRSSMKKSHTQSHTSKPKSLVRKGKPPI